MACVVTLIRTWGSQPQAGEPPFTGLFGSTRTILINKLGGNRKVVSISREVTHTHTLPPIGCEAPANEPEIWAMAMAFLTNMQVGPRERIVLLLSLSNSKAFSCLGPFGFPQSGTSDCRTRPSNSGNRAPNRASANSRVRACFGQEGYQFHSPEMIIKLHLSICLR